MADNITVRTGEGPAPAGGTETSAKKSKLDEHVDALAQHIKHRTGRNIDDEVLRAMALRKIAKAEQKELSAAQQKEFQKTTSNETLQTKVADDHGLLIGRGREANTADGLTNQQRGLVASHEDAPAILPPPTHAPITAEAASNVLEKIFGFLKPASAEAAPLTIETYSETLVPRQPSKPGDKPVREDGQHAGGQPGTGASEAPLDRPTTTTTLAGGTVGEPQLPEHPQRPTTETGRPVTPHEPEAPGLPRPPSTGNTLHLTPQRLPGQHPGQAPLESGATLLGKATVSGAHATDASGKTLLGKTVSTGGARGTAKGTTTAGLKSADANLRAGGGTGDDTPLDRPVTPGPVATGGVIIADEDHPQRPVETGGRPVTDDESHDPTLPKPPLGDRKTIHIPGKRVPGRQPGQAPSQSGQTLLGKTTTAGAHATDASVATPLGQTTVTNPRGTIAGSTPTGPRPGGGGTVGGPVGGRPRSPTPLSREGSHSGATLSLRGGRSRSLRATDVTTDPHFNTGGGFDTTTSWDGMHFNWEAFFVKFMFKFQEDENEARHLMKELRDAMHKLAQEGIKAKIAIEKMNQAFERAEKAFEVGAALKSVMDAAASSAQGQQGQQGQQGANGPQGQQQNPNGPNGPQGQQQQNDPGAAPTQPRSGGPPQQGRTQAPPNLGTNPGGPQPAGPQAGGPQQAQGQGHGQGQQQQGQGGSGIPGGGLVGNVSEHLRRDLEKINQELIGSAQRGGSEMDARIRSAYMQAQGLFNQMCQLLAMSRSK